MIYSIYVYQGNQGIILHSKNQKRKLFFCFQKSHLYVWQGFNRFHNSINHTAVFRNQIIFGKSYFLQCAKENFSAINFFKKRNLSSFLFMFWQMDFGKESIHVYSWQVFYNSGWKSIQEFEVQGTTLIIHVQDSQISHGIKTIEESSRAKEETHAAKLNHSQKSKRENEKNQGKSHIRNQSCRVFYFTLFNTDSSLAKKRIENNKHKNSQAKI